jgi:hypothetical protein
VGLNTSTEVLRVIEGDGKGGQCLFFIRIFILLPACIVLSGREYSVF